LDDLDEEQRAAVLAVAGPVWANNAVEALRS